MQQRQLTLPLVFHRAEEVFPRARITAWRDGGTSAVTYSEWAQDVRRVVTALRSLDLPPGSRVATICANTLEHLTLYFAVPCAGLVLHTVNHRLSADHLAHVLHDADARVVVIDRSLLASVLPVVETVRGIQRVVVVGGDRSAVGRLTPFESLLDHEPYAGDLPEGDEDQAASICYTSGTTGLPKGVVYSHRSLVLHALMIVPADSCAIRERDVVMPIVPMFHANAWGLPYAAVLSGADIVLPGQEARPARLVDLIEDHRVTVTAGVATVWRDMLPHAAGRDLRFLAGLSGGGPLPTALARDWLHSTGVVIRSSWGMTELGPSGTVARMRAGDVDGSEEHRLDVLSRPGTPGSLVRLRIADPDTAGAAPVGDGPVGEVQVSGPSVAAAYLGNRGTEQFTADGWLRTGDVGTLSASADLQITDRLKDVIKSGGEWISSIDLENALMEHPEIAEAAVIGVPHERWDERPYAFVVPREGAELRIDSVREHLAARVAKWWIPEQIEVTSSLPRNATGKIAKSRLRTDRSAAVDQAAAQQ